MIHKNLKLANPVKIGVKALCKVETSTKKRRRQSDRVSARELNDSKKLLKKRSGAVVPNIFVYL
jgi:hypothetical protein